MTASLLSGKPLAKLIQQQAQTEAKALTEEGTCPALAVVVATEDSSTHWYVRSIERAAEQAGINCRIIDAGHDATEQVLITVLKDLSADASVNGIILQTPCRRVSKARSWPSTFPRPRTSTARTR